MRNKLQNLIAVSILFLILLTMCFAGCAKANTNLNKIKVNEIQVKHYKVIDGQNFNVEQAEQ